MCKKKPKCAILYSSISLPLLHFQWSFSFLFMNDSFFCFLFFSLSQTHMLCFALLCLSLTLLSNVCVCVCGGEVASYFDTKFIALKFKCSVWDKYKYWLVHVSHCAMQSSEEKKNDGNANNTGKGKNGTRIHTGFGGAWWEKGERKKTHERKKSDWVDGKKKVTKKENKNRNVLTLKR